MKLHYHVSFFMLAASAVLTLCVSTLSSVGAQETGAVLVRPTTNPSSRPTANLGLLVDSELLNLQENAATVSSSDSPTQWSLHPLIYGHVPSQAIASGIGDINFLLFIFCGSLLLALAYPLTHKLLLKMSRKYRALKDVNKQIVVTHHALEALVLSLLFPFFSYFMIRLNFQDTHNRGMLIMLMYLFELASRFDTSRPLLIFHHVLAFLDVLLITIFPTSIMMKTLGILSYFICFEAPTFMGLFMYRIFPDSKVTPNVILFGMLCLGISRLFQVAAIGAAIFGSWNDEHVVKWQGVMQVIVTLILTGVQLLTLTIHYGVWKRCVARGKSGTTSIVDDELEELGKSHIDEEIRRQPNHPHRHVETTPSRRRFSFRI